MDEERLQCLLPRYFDQMLTVEERSELSQMLLASARARGEFWEMARWNALIRQWGEAEWGRRDAETITLLPLPARPAPACAKRKIVSFPRLPQVARSITLAAAATIALYLAAPTFLSWFRKPAPESPPNLAVLTHSAEAVWAEGSTPRQRGESLQPGWLRLESGAVQVEFSRGARVVLEGPVEMQLLTDNAAFLRHGKLRAQVPDAAHGFTIRAPAFTLVDHGTEFGCDLPLKGTPQVHVFNGLVALKRPKSPEQQLWQNQAIVIERDRIRNIPARRDRFLSDEELARREFASVFGRLIAWRDASRRLSEHPAALLHLDFETDPGWTRSIPNRAWRAVPETPASMVGCEFAAGRWPGKGAVEFHRPDDRLRLTLPGAYESMTLLAWLRLDSLPDRPQSLIMADGMGTGDVQWYITRWGELGFGVHIGSNDDPTRWRYHHTQPIFTPETLRTWVCVATVFDGTTDIVTHYFNGQPVGSDRLPVRTLLQLETFEIGNWALRSTEQRRAGIVTRSAGDSTRNLLGRIDELCVLSAPLSPGDIWQMYEVGRPDEGITQTPAPTGRAE